MVVSEWKENFKDFGVWTATNCNSPGGAPKIVGGGRNARDAGFHAFATDGSVMNMGEEFATFEDAAMFLETVFSWEVKING